MRLIATTAAAGLLIALGGCGDTDPTDENVAAVPEAENVHDAIAEMPEGQRNAVFIRAIRDANQDCQHVESSTRSGEHQGMPVWTATCEGGAEWTIVLGPDGTASVLNPAERQLVGNDQSAQNVQGQ